MLVEPLQINDLRPKSRPAESAETIWEDEVNQNPRERFRMQSIRFGGQSEVEELWVRRSRLPSVARQLLAEIPDADLLERYIECQADDAFAQLVTRYSRLVWGQCRNLLPDDADADDAFQATFLTLARSAKSIRTGAPLGPWLHGVAYRVCQNARRAMQRRAKREKACAIPEADRPIADSTWEAAFTAVSEEVQKLPESQRTAFVLCCIEGRATTEAAASLGQKLGTFSARLTRAKQTLLDRLAKRGLGAAVLALGGVTGSVSVAPAALVERTLTLIPPGVIVPSSVNALMHGVTGMMMFRFKLLAAGVMVATGLGLSVGAGWSNSATAQVTGAGAPPAAKPTPKGDGSIEKLKADLERAKAELAQAEAKMENAEVERAKLRLTQAIRGTATAAPKYEYEPLIDKGLTTQAFEAKLAEREKAGWEFLGQVSFDTSKVPGAAGQLNNGTTPCFVFRKVPPPRQVIRQGLTRLNNLDGDFLPLLPLPNPADGPVPNPADGPVAPADSIPATALPAPGLPPGMGDALSSQLRELEYKNRIAELEKQIRDLKAAQLGMPVPKGIQGTYLFEKETYGNWEPDALLPVLRAVLDIEIKSKKYTGTVTFKPGQDRIYVVTDSPELIAEVDAWIKKLKK